MSDSKIPMGKVLQVLGLLEVLAHVNSGLAAVSISELCNRL